MVLRASFFLSFYESGAGHSHSYRVAGSFLHIISLFAEHLRTTHQKILKACPSGFSDWGGSCLCSIPVPNHAERSPFSFCLAHSESATCHHWRRPLTTTTGLLYSLPSSSSSFSCFVDLLLIFNRLLQAFGSAQKPLVTPTSILRFPHFNPNA